MYVFSRNVKNIRIFYLIFFYFLIGKFSVYLYRRVFVMGGKIDFENQLPLKPVIVGHKVPRKLHSCKRRDQVARVMSS